MALIASELNVTVLHCAYRAVYAPSKSMTSGPLFLMRFDHLARSILNAKRVLNACTATVGKSTASSLRSGCPPPPGPMPDLNDYSPLRNTLPCVLKGCATEQR